MKKVIYVILFALSIGLANAQNANELNRLVKINLKSIESVYDEQSREIDSETQAIRMNRNERFRLEAGEASEMALSYLQARQDVYKLNMDNVKLDRVHPSSGGSTSVYFRQHINNIPVYMTSFIVRINRENVVTYALNEFRNTAKYADIRSVPSVNDNDALKIARDCLSIVDDDIEIPIFELVYFESKDKGLELAWHLSIRSKHRGPWRIFVSASDGCIIHAEIAVIIN